MGASFIISIDNGLVLDYVIKRKTCQLCKRNPNASEDWKKAHRSTCGINHTQSSEAMEKEAVVEMFINSIQRRKLKYGEYVGDGDTNSFGAVVLALTEKYGDGKFHYVGGLYRTYTKTNGCCITQLQK